MNDFQIGTVSPVEDFKQMLAQGVSSFDNGNYNACAVVEVISVI